ncbi:MAG: hypothetical protein G01um101420_375 [Parcubacteria group bacterium Gr01-1014_20]|nr:MAG: hypothetical protein G01um101420_375 [Parcubacteria group bacterium Gr01-1014_20]
MSEIITFVLNFVNGVCKPLELTFGLACFVVALSIQMRRNAIRIAFPLVKPRNLKGVLIFSALGIICLNLFIRLPNPFHTYEGTVGAIGCSAVIVVRAIQDIRKKRALKRASVVIANN